MPKWKVYGADRYTGNDRSLFLDAATKDAAINYANANGLVVEDAVIAPAMAEPASLNRLGYEGSRPTNGSHPPKLDAAVRANAMWLRVMATLANAFGAVFLVLAVAAVATLVVQRLSGFSPATEFATLTVAAELTLAGVFLCGFGAALRMLSFVGEKVSQIEARG